MSNGALLRLHGSGTYGHDSGFNWEALYKNGAAWEKAGAWWGGNNGNILACPAGATVLVAMADGKMAFVRSSGGEWKSFLMDVPDLELLKLEPAVIQAIRNSMQLPSDARLLYPYKAQFHPADRELWLDYRTTKDDVYRMRLALEEDGKMFKYLSASKLDPNPRESGARIPRVVLDAGCSAIVFF